MRKTAFLCSGQGSQYSGMGRELFENFAEARKIYECGSDILGFDLARLSFEGSETELARTAVSQPAIFAVSLAAHAALEGISPPAAYAGHSLGEYAALTLAGAFTVEDGFRVIGARAAAMQRAAQENPGAMYAIIGSDEQTIFETCQSVPGFVLPVNFNAPTQTVLAGDPEGSKAAAEAMAAKGAKVVKLAVSSAFHCRMMSSAAAELTAKIALIPVCAPALPFYCNVTGTILEPGTDLKAYLAKHLISPVHFHQEVTAMLADGIDIFVELGPNKVLTSLIKRGYKQASAYNVENLKTLEKFRATLADVEH